MNKPYVKFGNYKVEYDTVKPLSIIKTLYCSCCGECTEGRQWWNRDTGYGLCDRCADMISKKEDEDTMKSCYGEKGIHYAIKGEK